MNDIEQYPAMNLPVIVVDVLIDRNKSFLPKRIKSRLDLGYSLADVTLVVGRAALSLARMRSIQSEKDIDRAVFWSSSESL